MDDYENKKVQRLRKPKLKPVQDRCTAVSPVHGQCRRDKHDGTVKHSGEDGVEWE